MGFPTPTTKCATFQTPSGCPTLSSALTPTIQQWHQARAQGFCHTQGPVATWGLPWFPVASSQSGLPRAPPRAPHSTSLALGEGRRTTDSKECSRGIAEGRGVQGGYGSGGTGEACMPLGAPPPCSSSHTHPKSPSPPIIYFNSSPALQAQWAEQGH